MQISIGRRIKVGATALCALALMGLTATPAFASARHAGLKAAKQHQVPVNDPVIYDSTVEPNPGNLPSESFEASAAAEFGNQITFGGTARVLDNVVVQLSSWGCESGNWSTYNTSPCVTTPGATFTEPITLNIYNVGAASQYGPSTTGSLITSVTQTFTIPYRPSADTNYTTDCAATATADDVPVSDFAGTWFDAALDRCFNGYLTPVTFNFGHVVLPNSVIYGIAYNTSDFGYQPYGDNTACHSSAGGCGYDSLNVALSQEPTAPSVGSDDYPGTVYENIDNEDYAVNDYCDAGAAGINVFRIDEPADYPTTNGTDSNCWSVEDNSAAPYYVPAVQFNAVSSEAALITSADSASAVAGTPFAFSVTTTGVPTPTLTARGKIPHGLSFVMSNGGATISGTPLLTDRNGTYKLTLRAVNLPDGGRSRQTFTITLTGGKGKS